MWEEVELLALDVTEAESYASGPLQVTSNLGCRNCVVVEVCCSEHNGSIIDLTSVDDVHPMGSGEEE